MKKILFAALAAAMALPAAASFREAPAAETQPENPDSTGFVFTDLKIIKTTPVKDQNKSGTCWSFAGTSMLEEEVLRKGGKELDLSEMFCVRNNYIDKAIKYVRTDGKINFAQGGSFADVFEAASQYGVIPEEAYNGLNYGEDKHMHYEMAGALQAYLDAILKNNNKRLSTAWLDGYIGILDAYLGKVPEKFTYEGKTYTPKEFAKAIGIAPENYISVTSFTHHPFYENFPIEVADNWRWAESLNVPLDDLKKIIDNALENGYTVGWGADVSEGGFKWAKGFCVLPEPKKEGDMDGTELARWVKLSDKERENSQFDIKGPVKEKTVTQESRQDAFERKETTDDHAMVLVGTAVDQEGNRYYKVKNSWDTNQIYDGYFYVSEPFVLEKTMNIMVDKAALPKDIAKKCK